MYYSPLKIRTKEGIFLGKTKDFNSFYFDFNRKDNTVNNNSTITKYYHLMKIMFKFMNVFIIIFLIYFQK